jgi:hypothetical protein
MLTAQDRAKLAAKPKGLRTRVNLMCKDCIYDPEGTGTWRKQVENCTVTLCPLWEIRPRSRNG